MHTSLKQIVILKSTTTNTEFIIFKRFICFHFMCMHASMCTMCMPSIHRGKKRVPDLLELELCHHI